MENPGRRGPLPSQAIQQGENYQTRFQLPALRHKDFLTNGQYPGKGPSKEEKLDCIFCLSEPPEVYYSPEDYKTQEEYEAAKAIECIL